MGQAKLKRSLPTRVVYHHTSTLRTNLLWMSGVVELEGHGGDVLHPDLGRVKNDVSARRACVDFPALAWFTKRIAIPQVLVKAELFLEDGAGRRLTMEQNREIVNAIALQRMALGFPISEIPVVPWPEHRGYATGEGKDLNASARAAGDDPDDWYVSEVPVDLMKMSEIWTSRSVHTPKLERNEKYLWDVREMVTICREKGALIPPTWVKPEVAVKLAKRMGLKVANADRFDRGAA